MLTLPFHMLILHQELACAHLDSNEFEGKGCRCQLRLT